MLRTGLSGIIKSTMRRSSVKTNLRSSVVNTKQQNKNHHGNKGASMAALIVVGQKNVSIVQEDSKSRKISANFDNKKPWTFDIYFPFFTVKDIAFDAADRVLLARYDGTVQVWDWRHSSLLAELVHSNKPCRAVAAHPTLPLIVSGGDDCAIRLWDSNTFACLATVTGHMDYIRRPWLMSCGDDQTVRVWHITAHSLELVRVLTHHAHYVMDIAVHAAHSDELVSVSLDGTMAVWDLTHFTLKSATTLSSVGLTAVNYNSAGDELMVAGDRGVLLRVDRATHSATPLTGHACDVHHAEYFDDRTILSAAADSTVRVWCSTNGTRHTQHAFAPRRGRVWKVCRHPTEPGLCAAALDDGVQFFQVALEPLTVTPFTPVVTSIAPPLTPEPSNGKNRRGWLYVALLVVCYLGIVISIMLQFPDKPQLAWYWYMFMSAGVMVCVLVGIGCCMAVGMAVYGKVTQRKRKVDTFKAIV